MQTAIVLLASVLASSMAFADDKSSELFAELYKKMDLTKQQLGVTDYEGLIEFSKKHTNLEIVQDGLVVYTHCKFRNLRINYTLSPEKPYQFTFSAPNHAAFDRIATIQVYERGPTCSERILLFDDTVQIMPRPKAQPSKGPFFILRNIAGQKL